jgi:hypothetical protein
MNRPSLVFAVLSVCALAAAQDAPTTPAAPPSAPARPSVVNASGLPRAPAFALEGTSGTTRRLRDYLGRVVIIVYEDRDSNQQNNALKQELAERARRDNLARDVSLVAVANLSAYDFWPARGYARDAVIDIARQQSTEIMIDWSGQMATDYHFRAGTSYVMVVSRDGRVLFRYGGAMSARFREQFFGVVAEAIQSPR